MKRLILLGVLLGVTSGCATLRLATEDIAFHARPDGFGGYYIEKVPGLLQQP